eukprot:UN20211
MTDDHNSRVRAWPMLTAKCECCDEGNRRSKKCLLGYYKLGHTIGVVFINLLTMVKALLLTPFLSACCGDPEEDNSERLVAARNARKRSRKSTSESARFGSKRRNATEWKCLACPARSNQIINLLKGMMTVI